MGTVQSKSDNGLNVVKQVTETNGCWCNIAHKNLLHSNAESFFKSVVYGSRDQNFEAGVYDKRKLV